MPENRPCSRLGLYPQSVRKERQLSREGSRGVFCIVSHICTEMHEFPEIPQKALRWASWADNLSKRTALRVRGNSRISHGMLPQELEEHWVTKKSGMDLSAQGIT